MTAAEPISDSELDAILSSQLSFPVALAVSGGADSMALMLLTARFVCAHRLQPQVADGREAVIILTVDHGLRPESGAEATWIKGEAARLGFRHETLVWQGPKPTTGIQVAAREARYEMMARYIESELREAQSKSQGRQLPERSIVTAHHQDDQAETLLMRLARGSGIDGLTGMHRRTRIHGVPVLRPLLDVPKSRLVATLRACHATWREDPSNESVAFERVRLRRAKAALAELGLTSEPLALSARRLARAREALEAAATGLSRTAGLDLHSGAYASLDREKFMTAPEELRVRLMARLIAGFGGQAGPARLASVEELCARLQEGTAEAGTLSGAMVRIETGRIEVYRELGREGLPAIELCAGEQKVWDRRFRVSWSPAPAVPGAVSVGPLGREAYSGLRPKLRGPALRLPARAAATLPAFRHGDRLLAVPHFGFVDRSLAPLTGDEETCQAQFIGMEQI
jgi:tRNA(Ile)-lysidine synthase